MATHPLRILLVEDHGATNEALKRMLARRGHRVTTATTGESALASVRFQAFDLVISDIGLPDTDGWTLLRQLRTYQVNLRAIALTGYGYPRDIVDSSEAGFDAHLTKPTDMPTLELVIEQLFPPFAPDA